MWNLNVKDEANKVIEYVVNDARWFLTEKVVKQRIG